jgi:arylsulfatase A-like enzyme
MGAHGVIQKHNFFYDSFTHVPFIVAWPGAAKTGRRDELVELVDIMPTLLDAAGCEHPFGLQGKSLAPYFTGGEYTPRPFAVIESGEHGEPMTLSEITTRPEDPFDESCFVWCAWREAWLGRGRCIRSKDWKLSVYTNGEAELYDMNNDPDELHNLIGRPEYEEIAQQLRNQLLLWTIDNLDAIPLNTTVGLNYRSKYAAK